LLPAGSPTVDIVVPVFRALHHVRTCLASLAAWTNDVAYRLIVVDDASGADVNKELSSLIAPWGDQAELLTNPHNQGFLPTANRGMRSGHSSIVVVLNTDTYVTPGWLAGLLRCLESSPTAGIASPLSNNMNLTRIRGHYGANALMIAEAIRRQTRRDYPEIRLASGACMAIRRAVLNEVGYFDPVFGRGYYEETDLCLRAASRGWRTLADDATYVHHHGTGSFREDEMTELMARNGRIFEERWGQGAKRKIVREVERRQPFAELERRLALGLTYKAQTTPRRPLPPLGGPPKERTSAPHPRHSTPIRSNPSWWRKSYGEWRRIAEKQVTQPDRSAGDVLLLVDDLHVNPWTSDALRIADLLLEAGLDVSVATSGEFDQTTLLEPCRLSPYILAGPDELLEVVRPHRWVIATSPSAVYDALLLRERDGSRVVSWFQPDALTSGPLPPGDGPALSAAFGLVSMHLHAGEMFAAGTPIANVPIGVDLDVYAGSPGPSGPEVLLLNGNSGFQQTSATIVDQLDEAGLPVTVYGQPIDGVDPTVIQPLLPKEEEARMLRGVGVVAEVSPIVGLERFRLRVAATRTPLVVGCPTISSCRLRVGRDVHGVSWGDAPRLVQLVQDLMSNGRDLAIRAEAAVAQAHSSPLHREARSILEALEGSLRRRPMERPDPRGREDARASTASRAPDA
jgi:GT2 family glycosyltransferase